MAVAVLSNQPPFKYSTKLLAKKSTLSRELKALGITNSQEKSSRLSVRLFHPETLQPEEPFYPNIELPAKTPVLIKQSASSQKLQKLSGIIHKSSELSEPSKSDESDSDTSKLS